jgi:membrane protease YdiL (CAAX protease family)
MTYGVTANRLSVRILIVLAVIALLTVLSGYTQPPQADEGTGAHIFQLAVVAFALVTLLFFATINWKRPLQSLSRLALPASTLGAAFAALYYLEHVYYKK